MKRLIASAFAAVLVSLLATTAAQAGDLERPQPGCHEVWIGPVTVNVCP